MTLEQITQRLEPGTQVKLLDELHHIRAIVDDNQVVSRVWNRHKQVWVYHVRSTYGFWIAFKHGMLEFK